ncbi:MAG: CopD family protein [Nitrospirae bacterium]|nr:CopD family protein [Nitrospirota bacterium]
MTETFIHIIPAWVELIALAFCTGALVCRLLVLEPSHTAAIPYYKNLLVSMWRLLFVALTAMTIVSIVDLLTRTAEMSGLTFRASFPLLPTVISKTHYGYFWLMGMVTLILLWIAWCLSRRYRDSRKLSGFMLCLAAVFAFSLSATGHASDKGDFSVAEMTDWFHLIAASVWGGGLMVLSTVVLPQLVKPDNRQKAIIADVAGRFSRIAGISVGVVIITASYNSWYFVGSLTEFGSTPYGLAAAVKIILLCFLLFLGAFNRYINVALLQQWAGRHPEKRDFISSPALNIYGRLKQSRDGRLVAFRFLSCVTVEALLIVSVLLFAAFLRHEVPSRHMAHQGHSGEGMSSHPSNDGNDGMQHHGHNH